MGKSEFGVISGSMTSTFYPVILCMAFILSLLPLMALKWLSLHQLSHIGTEKSTEALRQVFPHISLVRTESQIHS